MTIPRGTGRIFFLSLPEETPGLGLVPPVLLQDVEHVPVLFHGPPQVPLHAVDFDEHLVQVPLVTRLRTAPTQSSGIDRAEPACPLADCLVAEFDAALEHSLLDVAQAQVEAVVSHTRWETTPGGKRKLRYDGVIADSPSSDSARRMIMPPEKTTTQPDNAPADSAVRPWCM